MLKAAACFVNGMLRAASVCAQLVFKGIILEHEVLLQAVAPAGLLIVVDDIVVEVYIRALLILIIRCLWLLVPLQHSQKPISTQSNLMLISVIYMTT